tara:strand:- start:305 stop:487 length:183 start_codon:yes stop_codon:yes gene_type:complete
MSNRNEPNVNISQLEAFWYEVGEDWHLWDESQQGPYPINRVFAAMKQFIDYHKNKNKEDE